MNEIVQQTRRGLLAVLDTLRSQNDDAQEARHPPEFDQPSVGRLSRTNALRNQAMAKDASRRREARER